MNATTITATELRKNLDSVLSRVGAGQKIIVTHRFRKPVVIQNIEPEMSNQKKRLDGLKTLEKARLRPSPFDPNKSIKELYRESMSKKYGIE